jgi:nucleoid DNA-binding protein
MGKHREKKLASTMAICKELVRLNPKRYPCEGSFFSDSATDVDFVIKAIQKVLEDGYALRLPFCELEVIEKAAYIGHDPRKLEMVHRPAQNKLKVTTSDEFKKKLNA